ncbi:MAG: mechanosensitive ion channel family protein [Fulvivirga sp.]|uniref:mechanosensitive ion channel family protein n=1 Tax=Fulvivirga sp. TaxID=1931237 RepID=UPI0032ED5589
MKKLLTILLVFVFFVSYSQKADTLNVDSVETIAIVDSIQNKFLNPDTVQSDTLSQASDAQKKIQVPPIHDLISFGKIFWSIIFLIIGYFTLRFLGSVLEKFAEKSTTYRITIKGFIPILKIVGWAFILFIIIAGIFQPPINAVLTATASLGIAIGFAAQDIIKNIFGGIMILFDRPFQVGDKIEIGNFYGEVVEIGLRSTRIVTPDDSLVSVPNSEVMNTSVSNANAGEPNCQVVAEIYLPITVDTTKVRQVAIEAAQVSKYIYLNKPIVVLFFNEVKERRSYLKMRLKAYVADIRYEFAFKSDMTELVMRELLKSHLINPDDLK